ncbi:hypothetical protein [Streptomyces sp. NBC_01216]|uniref:hypothetical protein n=1 Tax=unclassified Streptomyces TaxID=2593676 RepID=UPI002E10683B|nr:hypothetical protein OG393_17830 [Streptomyces sp. NBC_01216]
MTNVLVESLGFPEFGRPDAGLVLISEWRVEDAAHQRAVIDGVVDAWAEAPLPEAFLSRYCLAGSDGRTILNVAHWTSAEAHLAFSADPVNQRSLGSAIGSLITAGPPGRYTFDRVSVLREGRPRGLSTSPLDGGTEGGVLARYHHRGEDGRLAHVLTAHDDDGDGTVLRFRPRRGLLRPVARDDRGESLPGAARDAVRPRG